MTKIIRIIFFLLFSICLRAQSEESFLSSVNFKSATAISINSLDHIFVTDGEENTLVKLNRNGDIIASIGGYGWDVSTFDSPEDVISKNFTLYVVDKNNHRIQLFDRDLNFIGLIKPQDNNESEFRYPTSIDVSDQGDIYVLDSEHSRVLKFNSSGNLTAKIGDIDAGNFALSSPKDLALFDNNFCIVISANDLLVFDLFGNGITEISFPFEAKKITTWDKKCFISTSSEVFCFSLTDLDSPVFTKIHTLADDNKIENITVKNNELFILTNKAIYIIDLEPDKNK